MLSLSPRSSKVYVKELVWLCRDGLDYNNMMVLTMNMPSGFVSEDLQEARNQNPSVVRMEQEDDMVHCYFNQVRPGSPWACKLPVKY